MASRFLSLLFLLSLPFIGVGQTLIDRSLATDFKMNFQDAIQLADGSIVFAVTGSQFSGFDSTQSVLIKVDTALDVQWIKRYKGYNRDDFASLTLLADGNFLATGTIRTPALAPEGGAVYKLDPDGNVIWYQVYDDSFDDRVIAAFEQTDSTLILVDRKGVTNTPTKVIHASKLGGIISARTYSDSGQGLVVDEAASDGQGNYFLIGDRQNNNQPELVIMAFTDTVPNWTRAFNFGRAIFPTSAICDSSGNLIISASIEDTSTFLFTFNTVLMELDANTGALSWAQEIDQDLPYTNSVSDLKLTASKNILGSGSFGTDDGTSAWALEADRSGNLIWWKGYHQFDKQSFTSLLPVEDGRFLMAGGTDMEALIVMATDSGESSCSDTHFTPIVTALTPTFFAPSYDAEVPTLTTALPGYEVFDLPGSDSLICKRTLAGTTSLKGETSLLFQLYPNPAEDHVQFVWQAQSPAQLELHDVQGRILLQLSVQPDQSLTLDLSSYPKGMYLLQLQSAGQSVVEKLIRE